MGKPPTKTKSTAKKQKINETLRKPKTPHQRAQRSSKPNRLYFNDDFEAAHNDNEMVKLVPDAYDTKSISIEKHEVILPQSKKPITGDSIRDVASKSIPKVIATKPISNKKYELISPSSENLKIGDVKKSVHEAPATKLISTKKHEMILPQSSKPTVDVLPKAPATKSMSIKKHEVVPSKKTTGVLRGKSAHEATAKKTSSTKKHEASVLPASNNQMTGAGRPIKDRSNKFIRLRYELDFTETGSNVNVDDYVKYLMNNMKVDGRKNNLENVEIKKRSIAKVEVMAKVNFKKKGLRYLTEKFLAKQNLKYKVVSKNKRSYKIIPKKDKQI